jgi:hypothetical protein
MLALDTLKSQRGKKKINGRPVAFVKEVETGKTVGLLKILDDEDSEIGEELIELPKDLEFKLCPETRDSMIDVVMCTGPQGVGKSTIAASYFNAFDELFDGDESTKYIISADDIDDPAFEGIPHTRIIVDETWDEAPPQLEDFISKDGGRVVICLDDTEGCKANKKRALAFENLVERILTQGRKHLINTFMISHLAANSKATRNILNELNTFIYFPRLGNGRNLQYCLDKHINMSKEMRDYLKNSDWGRSVTIKKNCPEMIIGQHRAAIYNHDDCAAALKKRSIIDKKRATMEAEQMLGLR